MENFNLVGTNTLNGTRFELRELKAPQEIIIAATGQTMKQFIIKSNNTSHLIWLLNKKAGSKGFPSKQTIQRKMFFVSCSSFLLFFLKGKKGLAMIKNSIIKRNLKIQ